MKGSNNSSSNASSSIASCLKKLSLNGPSFNDLIDKVVDLLAENSNFNRSDLSRLLIKSNAPKKSDFALFLTSLTEDPKAAAIELQKKLQLADQTLIEDIEVTDKCISFNLNKKNLIEGILKRVLIKNDSFGSNSIGEGQTVVLDYSSPNIAKLFHVGHFRTTILGQFIVNLLKFSGYKTVSINYLGDWGKQFGLVLLGYEKFGNEEELKKDPLMHLFHVYVKISKMKECHEEAKEIFRKMEEDNNEKYMSQWKFFRETSVNKYKQLYKKLNIEFDVYSGESYYNEKAKQFANSTPLACIDGDNCRYIECGKLGNALITKSDGTTLYITRDICAIEERMKVYNPSKIIYVVSSEQNHHFEQLFTIAEKLGYDRGVFEHVNFGLVKGMSTREGRVHFIDDVIETATGVMKDFIKDKNNIQDKDSVALTLAISFLLVCDFSAKRIKGYTFNIEQRAKTEKGQAIGPNLQYTHCRLQSIEDFNKHLAVEDPNEVDFSLLNEKIAGVLAYKILWFEQVIELTLKDYEPSRIVFYLQDLFGFINSAISVMNVKDAEPEVGKARLALFKAARIVISNGIKLLGLIPLNKM